MSRTPPGHSDNDPCPGGRHAGGRQSSREWEKSPVWRQVAENTTRRATFGQNTRRLVGRDETRWDGVSK